MITQQLLPRYRYDIHPNLLRTSHRIFYEARAIFRQNIFVRINTRALGFREYFTSWGFVPVSSGRRAKDVGDIAMSITYEDDLNDNGEELFVIFALEDLRHLCRYFHSLYTIDRIQDLAFKVVIHGSSEIRGLGLDHHSQTLASSRSHRLLEPLTELYAIDRFSISGPVDREYKHKTIHHIARPAPRHEESVEVIEKLWAKGDDALGCHQAAVAQEHYIAALLHLETRIWAMNRIESRYFNNAPRYKFYHIGRNFLLGRLALTFMRMRNFDKAHYWACHALDLIERHKGRISYPPDQYARLARLTARSSLALRKTRRAMKELGWALHFEPNNALIKADLVQLSEKVRRLGAGG